MSNLPFKGCVFSCLCVGNRGSFLIFVEKTMLLGNSFPMWDPSKGQNRTQKYSIYTPLARGKKMVLIRRDPAAIYILSYGFWLAIYV